MRAIKSVIILTVILTLSAFSSELKKNKNHLNFSFFDNVNVEMVDGDVVFTYNEEPYDIVIFKVNNSLVINGENIELNKRQRKLVEEYRNSVMDMIDGAKRIGFAGAHVGVKGAEIGVKAVVNVLKLMDEDYDSDDYAKELEEAAEKLKMKTEELEEMGDELKELQEVMDDNRDELKESLRELRKFDWF